MIFPIDNRSSDEEGRVLILPHAGGFSSQYAYLAKAWGGGVFSLNYPTSNIYDFDKFAVDVAQTIVSFGEGSWRFVGVSMGGYLSFLVSSILSKLNLVSQLDLVSVGNPSTLSKKLKEDNFITNFIDLAIPAQVVEMSEAESFYKSKLFEDLSFFSTTHKFENERVSVPINIYFGKKDHLVNFDESMKYWSGKSAACCNFFFFDGGHVPRSILEQKSLVDSMQTNEEVV